MSVIHFVFYDFHGELSGFLKKRFIVIVSNFLAIISIFGALFFVIRIFTLDKVIVP